MAISFCFSVSLQKGQEAVVVAVVVVPQVVEHENKMKYLFFEGT